MPSGGSESAVGAAGSFPRAGPRLPAADTTPVGERGAAGRRREGGAGTATRTREGGWTPVLAVSSGRPRAVAAVCRPRGGGAGVGSQAASPSRSPQSREGRGRGAPTSWTHRRRARWEGARRAESASLSPRGGGAPRQRCQPPGGSRTDSRRPQITTPSTGGRKRPGNKPRMNRFG